MVSLSTSASSTNQLIQTVSPHKSTPPFAESLKKIAKHITNSCYMQNLYEGVHCAVKLTGFTGLNKFYTAYDPVNAFFNVVQTHRVYPSSSQPALPIGSIEQTADSIGFHASFIGQHLLLLSWLRDAGVKAVSVLFDQSFYQHVIFTPLKGISSDKLLHVIDLVSYAAGAVENYAKETRLEEKAKLPIVRCNEKRCAEYKRDAVKAKYSFIQSVSLVGVSTLGLFTGYLGACLAIELGVRVFTGYATWKGHLDLKK